MPENCAGMGMKGLHGRGVMIKEGTETAGSRRVPADAMGDKTVNSVTTFSPRAPSQVTRVVRVCRDSIVP